MTKAVKRFLVCVLTVTMLMGMSTVASAAEKESDVPGLAKTNEDGITVALTENDGEATPIWWPGDGPAPQVTNILLYDYGFLENNHFCVILRVYGYGSDTTTFNGKDVDWFQRDPFIISGTGADGFDYWFDCGLITQAGNYPFVSKWRSTNYPYSERTFSDVFIFSPIE